MQGKGLREDVATGFITDLGDAGLLIAAEAGDLGLEIVKLDELGVDLGFQGFADGVLLTDECIGLLLLNLAAEAVDPILLGFDFG